MQFPTQMWQQQNLAILTQRNAVLFWLYGRHNLTSTICERYVKFDNAFALDKAWYDTFQSLAHIFKNAKALMRHNLSGMDIQISWQDADFFLGPN